MLKRLLCSALVACLPLAGDAVEQKPDAPFFYNAMPQSGPFYFVRTMSSFFDLDTFRVTKKTFPEDQIFENPFIRFIDQGDKKIVEAYADPSSHNIGLFQKHLPKFVLHVRDPREALVSWIDYVDRHRNHKFTLGRVPPVPPPEYFDWNFEEKADWQIEHYFSYCVDWLEQWLDTLDQHPELEIKVTTFEEMVTDPLNFFREIVSFYGGDAEDFTEGDVFPIWRAQYHFTEEDIATWKERLTNEQQERVTAEMPDRFFEYFGWELYTDRESKFKFQARKRPEFEPDAVDAEAVQLE